jgi:hypothetical protein
MKLTKLEQAVYGFKTKNKEGFTSSEMQEIVKKFEVDKDKFNKALGTNTCIMIDGEVITYHCDVASALHQVLTNKPQHPFDWD